MRHLLIIATLLAFAANAEVLRCGLERAGEPGLALATEQPFNSRQQSEVTVLFQQPNRLNLQRYQARLRFNLSGRDSIELELRRRDGRSVRQNVRVSRIGRGDEFSATLSADTSFDLAAEYAALPTSDLKLICRVE